MFHNNANNFLREKNKCRVQAKFSSSLHLCNTSCMTVAAERLQATVLMLREQNMKHASLFHLQTWNDRKTQMQRLLILDSFFSILIP